MGYPESWRKQKKPLRELNVDAVNQALATEVSTLNLRTGQFHKGRIIVDGITIEYTSYGVAVNSTFVG